MFTFSSHLASSQPNKRASQQAILVSLTVLLFIQLTEQLSFSAIKIPALLLRGSNFWLQCEARLGLGDQLYSVKWYKDNQEFYRLLANPDPVSSAGPQTQSFGQAGLNVLMSGSNATHVRLLNASLDSEGVYACEISSQNLSTIRYEREIRVYVLPETKTNIIGFRNRYALGEQVELLCSSDFSRPKPALGWFINGQRISKSSTWFELSERLVERPLETGRLLALSIGLKFRLTGQLLAALAKTGEPDEAHRGGNQSRARPAALPSPAPYQSAPETTRNWLPAPIRLQCKYKLTEVSDVTFNELAFAPNRKPVDGRPALSRLAKTSDNEVDQWPNPGQRGDLRRTLAQLRNQSSSKDTCQLEPLALRPDDPLIVVANEEAQPSGLIWAADDERRRRQLHGGPEVAKVELECLTLSALGELGEACEEPGSLRRALVSGLPEEPAAARRLNGGRWAEQATGRRSAGQVSYLSLTGSQLGQLGAQQPALGRPLADSTPQSDWAAPALLEWFINNQEAPKQPVEGAADELEASSEPARIDYAEHFANFDNRPIERSLPLKFKLDPDQHLTSPDSSLRLRCSSTQAQVLAFEAGSLTIVPTSSSSAGWQPKASRNQQRHLAKGQHQPSSRSSRGQGAASSSVTSSRLPSRSMSDQLLMPIALMLILAANL